MSLHEDLLEQAEHLMARERKKPKQASLRRAISAAYYALFHSILDEGSKQFATNQKLRTLVRRSFAHAEMKKAARSLASGGALPDHVAAIFSGTIPTELRAIARSFITLQERRHDADYNLNVSFTRSQAANLIALARKAFADWAAVKSRPADRAAVELFLTSMLLWDRWGK